MRHPHYSFPTLLSFLTVLIFNSALAGCSGASAAAATPAPAPGSLTPTTTLQAETVNNTSTADGFAAQGNGNAPAGNVSKAPVQQLLYAGSTTRIFVNWLPWFGGSNHMNVGYRSDDPAQVHRQVEDMISRGIHGAIIDWFGPNVDILSAA